jgi:hypothetical protein
MRRTYRQAVLRQKLRVSFILSSAVQHGPAEDEDTGRYHRGKQLLYGGYAYGDRVSALS